MSVPRRARAPLGDLAQLRREVNLLFERLAEFQAAQADEGSGAWRPAADVYEASGALCIVIELPGVEPDSLEVSALGRTLVVTGRRRPPALGGERATFLCVERPHGRFRRELPLEAPVDVLAARACFENGLLVVELPRLTERRGQRTSIPVERKNE